MKRVDEALEWACIQLAQQDTPQLDAQLLLAHCAERPRSWLFAHNDAYLSDDQWQKFQTLIARRQDEIPMAYLLGEQEFYGLALKVTPDVLIPRPETELLVDLALELGKNPAFSSEQKTDFEKNGETPLCVADLGTGSGAIALAIKQARPTWQVSANDQSAAALEVAQANAKRLGLKIDFYQGSWLVPFADRRFHLIVSNPPYIAPNDPHLNGSIRHEPDSALVAKQAGLADLFHIIEHAPHHLYPSGWLLLEHGYNQAADVQAHLKAHGFEKVRTEHDLAGNPRVSIGQWNN